MVDRDPYHDLGIDCTVFDHCSKLTNIIIPKSIPSIYEGMFAGCSSLTNIALPSHLIDGDNRLILNEYSGECVELSEVFKLLTRNEEEAEEINK